MDEAMREAMTDWALSLARDDLAEDVAAEARREELAGAVVLRVVRCGWGFEEARLGIRMVGGRRDFSRSEDIVVGSIRYV